LFITFLARQNLPGFRQYLPGGRQVVPGPGGVNGACLLAPETARAAPSRSEFRRVWPVYAPSSGRPAPIDKGPPRAGALRLIA